jgi:CubicO group peptidase (beta-lactamase class C family)
VIGSKGKILAGERSLCFGLLLALALEASVACVGSSGRASPPPPSAAPHPNDSELHSFWEALNQLGFRGVGLVARDRKVLLLAGSGGISPTATFNIASIAKPFTALAVTRLAHRGAISFNDPLARFFPTAPPDKRRITVHQLLTHTSGLGNPNGDTASGIKDRGEAVRMILATPLEYPPGSSYGYSNDGYTVLAAILEAATGGRWEDVIRDEVVRPAGLEHTFFLGDPLPEGAFAIPDDPVTTNRDLRVGANWGSKGGAGIFSNADDLLRLLRAASDGTLLGPESEQTIGESFAPPDRLNQYGRVFDLATMPGRGIRWSHGGADDEIGHFSNVQYFPQLRLAMVVLGLDSETLTHVVVTGLGKAAFGEGMREQPPPRRARPATGLAGVTLVGEGLRFAIVKDGRLETLVSLNPRSTTFLLARTPVEQAELEACVKRTNNLLNEVQELAQRGPLPDGVLGKMVGAWRKADKEDGRVKAIEVLGATPNWVDSLGGTLSFVRVERERGAILFRLYWDEETLRARGGSAVPNPAPLSLMDFGNDELGAWNPAVGAYVDLRLERGEDRSPRRVMMKAGQKTVSLSVQATSQQLAVPE